MTSILALAVVGSWTYPGFLAEPAAGPRPSATSPKRPPAPSRPEPPAIDFGPTSKPEPSPGPKALAPAAPSASTLSPSPRYRLADSSGQAWEHADPDYLRSFVEARNRSSTPPIRYQAPAYRASRCATGRCP